MSKILTFIIFIILSFFIVPHKSIACNKSDSLNKKLEWNTVKESTNHKDFYQFIFDNPETEYFDTAIKKFLHYRNIYIDSAMPEPFDCFHNCADILVNQTNKILFEGKVVELSQLDKLCSKFIRGDSTLASIPDIKIIKDPSGKNRKISKGAFELTFVPDSSDLLQAVFIKLSNCIKSYRDQLSLDWYNSKYNSLPSEEMEFVNRITINRIILWEYVKRPPPPPPPPTIIRVTDH
jgi:hypothetical protein